jgi:hypothetical protein
VGDASLDLSLARHGQDAVINVLRNDGQVAVMTMK